MTETADNKANLITGIVVLVALLAIGVYAVVKAVTSGPAQTGVKYVAYFENSGGLRDGDAVRIQGRRAGVVTAVGVVMRDGKAVTRVEFEINPGSGSQWLKDAPIPSDSTISVKTSSTLGRPQLLISIGNKNAEPIPEGGEWTRTRSANDQDQLSQFHEDIVRAQDQIAGFIKFFDDKQRFEDLNNQLGEITEAIKKADAQFEEVVGHAREVDGMLEDSKRSLDDTREQFAAQRESMVDNVNRVADNTERFDSELDKIDERLADASAEVERLKKDADGLATSAEKAKLDELGLELRKMAARLRSSMERATGDPSQFGDMPNWRRSRPYFNGGKPSNGTSIDENPPQAPGEESGVPTGTKNPKRVK